MLCQALRSSTVTELVLPENDLGLERATFVILILIKKAGLDLQGA